MQAETFCQENFAELKYRKYFEVAKLGELRNTCYHVVVAWAKSSIIYWRFDAHYMYTRICMFLKTSPPLYPDAFHALDADIYFTLYDQTQLRLLQ